MSNLHFPKVKKLSGSVISEKFCPVAGVPTIAVRLSKKCVKLWRKGTALSNLSPFSSDNWTLIRRGSAERRSPCLY